MDGVWTRISFSIPIVLALLPLSTALWFAALQLTRSLDLHQRRLTVLTVSEHTARRTRSTGSTRTRSAPTLTVHDRLALRLRSPAC